MVVLAKKTTSASKKTKTRRFAVYAARAKQHRAIQRGGSSLAVVKPMRGEDALTVLREAGVLTASGKLNPAFA